MKVSFLFYIVRLTQHLRPFLIGWKCPNSGPEQGSTENPAYIKENVQLSSFFYFGAVHFVVSPGPPGPSFWSVDR